MEGCKKNKFNSVRYIILCLLAGCNLLIEKYVNINTIAYLASEFRYKSFVDNPQETLFIFISQSGETADTLAALKFVKKNNCKTLSLVNVLESSIARESNFVLSIAAGPEIGVASTKAFTAQLCACFFMFGNGKRKRYFIKIR